ncbi:uncharacterized protein LOC119686050 [Teleopsis dalmanni]|uniref:uncharacterized protein LOC119686050 n=1 Tax=Teleopsis dalmanni TaxID=139649 RepID=UPI0018CDF230|nr:uncharacterized protein LOC119686050 [Teleopsis dalmanni]
MPGMEPRKVVTKEQKARNGYKPSVYYLRKMRARDSSSFTMREKHLIRKHEKAVAKFERDNATAQSSVEQGQSKVEAKFVKDTASTADKTDLTSAVKSSSLKLPPKIKPTGSSSRTPSSSTGKATKRARSEEETQKDSKKPKSSASFESPMELQVAIIDIVDPDGKITPKNWLLVEARLMTAMTEADSEELVFDGAVILKLIGQQNQPLKTSKWHYPF